MSLLIQVFLYPRNISFFGGTGALKMKRAQRPQNMFLFDPDFRYRLDEDNQDLEQTNNAQNAGYETQTRRKYPYSIGPIVKIAHLIYLKSIFLHPIYYKVSRQQPSSSGNYSSNCKNSFQVTPKSKDNALGGDHRKTSRHSRTEASNTERLVGNVSKTFKNTMYYVV